MRRGALVGLVVGTGVLAWSAGEGVEVEARARPVRVLVLLVSAVLAVGAPYVLLPDPDLQRLQWSNPGARRLLFRCVGRWLPVLGVLAVIPFAFAFRGGDTWMLAVEGTLASLGVGVYAFARTLPLGARIRRWEQGQSSLWYRSLRRRAETVSTAPPLAVPDSLVPPLLLTAEVFLAGSLVAIAGQAAQGASVFVAPSVLLALAVVLVVRQSGGFDRTYWTSNGVWTDALYTVGPDRGRERLPYAAVYWAPERVRPAVWAGLLSLDRRLPLGRLAATGLVLIALVHAVGAPGAVRSAVLLAWTVAINASVGLAAADASLPASLALRLRGVGAWTWTRFLMNLRWLPPFALTLTLIAWWTDSLPWAGAALWVGVYLAVAVLSAWSVSAATLLRARRSLA